jgi:hypothetical protein
MAESLINTPPASSTGTSAAAAEHSSVDDRAQYPDFETESSRDSPPGTPRWVKAFGIILVVLLLAFVGLHLTGNAPTHLGSSGMQHGIETTTP